MKCSSPNVKESEELILDPYLDPDQHKSLITSKQTPLAHACHVESTSVNAFVSYPAHSMTDRQTNRMTDRQTDRMTDRQTNRMTDRQTE